MKLRIISEQVRKAHIAHVGASADPSSVERRIWGDNDRWHIEAVFRWLDENTDDAEMLYSDNRSDDFIDLNDGRDFLKENGDYDIVILHMVYSPYGAEDNWRRYGEGSSSPFQTSRLHSPEIGNGGWPGREPNTYSLLVMVKRSMASILAEFQVTRVQ